MLRNIVETARNQNDNLALGAQKPETFPVGDFRISINTYEDGIMQWWQYKRRCSLSTHDFPRHWLDAPFSFTIDHQVEGSWYPLSTLAFWIDHTRNFIVIEQLQGGITSTAVRDREIAKKVGRARMKFKVKPEHLLYSTAHALATKMNMRGIALRKSAHSSWGHVQEDERTKEGTDVASQVSQNYQHHDFEYGAYTFERL